MSETAETIQLGEFQEPWEVVKGFGTTSVISHEDPILANKVMARCPWEKYAERIVLAVNACRGISNEDLARGVVAVPVPGSLDLLDFLDEEEQRYWDYSDRFSEQTLNEVRCLIQLLRDKAAGVYWGVAEAAEKGEGE